MTISNEDIYQRTWSTYVDTAIAQWAPGGVSVEESSLAKTGKIELRDLLQLEEVLEKLGRIAGRSTGLRDDRLGGQADVGCDELALVEQASDYGVERRANERLDRKTLVLVECSTPNGSLSPKTSETVAKRLGRLLGAGSTSGIYLDCAKQSMSAEFAGAVADIKPHLDLVDAGRNENVGDFSWIADTIDSCDYRAEMDRTTVSTDVEVGMPGMPRIEETLKSRAIEVTEGDKVCEGAEHLVSGREDCTTGEAKTREESEQYEMLHGETCRAGQIAGTLLDSSTTAEQLVDESLHPTAAKEVDVSGDGEALGITVLDCGAENGSGSPLDGSTGYAAMGELSAIASSRNITFSSSSVLCLDAPSVGSETLADAERSGEASLAQVSSASPHSNGHSPTPNSVRIETSDKVESSLGDSPSADGSCGRMSVTRVKAIDRPDRLNDEIVIEDTSHPSQALDKKLQLNSHRRVDIEITTGSHDGPDVMRQSHNCTDSPEILRRGSADDLPSGRGSENNLQEFGFRSVRVGGDKCKADDIRREQNADFLIDGSDGLRVVAEGSQSFSSPLSPGIIEGFHLDGADAPSPVSPPLDPIFADVDAFDNCAPELSTTSRESIGPSSPAQSDASTMSLTRVPDRLLSASAELEATKAQTPDEPAQTPYVAFSSKERHQSPLPRSRSSAEPDEDNILMPPPRQIEYVSPQQRSPAKCRTPNARARAHLAMQNSDSNNSSSDDKKTSLSCRSPLSQAATNPRVRRLTYRQTPQTQVRRRRRRGQDTTVPRSQPKPLDGTGRGSLQTSPRPVVDEQPSICSFSESEVGDHIVDKYREYAEREREAGSLEETGAVPQADISLVEGTPRRHQRAVGLEDDLSGFYAPLSVTYPMKCTSKDPNLSAAGDSTLRWMLWREGKSTEGEQEVSAALSSTPSETKAGNGNSNGSEEVSCGGMLGHLSSEEACACLMALIQRETVTSPSERLGRPGIKHASTGLPQGATLVVVPNTDAASEWSSRLAASRCGLSVLNYIMPLKERRRLCARQIAAFDAVVTTYDILKAKEVPRVVEPEASKKSPRSCRLPAGEWRSRNATVKGWTQAAAKTENTVSLLHGVWWHRVVADGAETLANQRSARVDAVLRLVGKARWCVVDREKMRLVENSSNRMRSLARILRVPKKTALVEVASCLFYNNRPSHVAPTSRHASGLDDIDASPMSAGKENEVAGCSRHSPCTPGGVRARARTLGLADRRQVMCGDLGLGSGNSAIAQHYDKGYRRKNADTRITARERSARHLGKQREKESRSCNAALDVQKNRGDVCFSKGVAGYRSGDGGMGEGGSASSLTRDDVTYAETRLSFKKVRGGRR